MDHFVNIEVLKPGLQSTIQDGGRVGFSHQGIPQGGYMDRRLAKIANWLVGNDLNSPMLEITLIGPKLRFSKSCQVAIAGRLKNHKLNGHEFPIFETINIHAGDTINLGQCEDTIRAYIAIGGTWKVGKWLNSVSVLHSFLSQNILAKNSKPIQIDCNRKEIQKRKFKNIWQKRNVIRITEGPERNTFKEGKFDKFLTAEFRIDQSANRHAYRLNSELGDLLSSKSSITSSGVLPGTIQVTKEGQPIILMADAQTTGGYRRIAQVIKSDLDYLAQLGGGDTINFELISVKQALEINRAYELEYLQQLK